MVTASRLVLTCLCYLRVVLLLLESSASFGLSADLHHRRLLVLGLGPVGRAVAKRALELPSDENDGDLYGGFEVVHGTVRSPEEIGDDGIRKILFSRENILQTLPSCTHALITIPPQPEDSSLDEVWNVMEKSLPRGTWLGFVSTTGVYGDHGGATVTEASPLRCEEHSQAAKYRDAENTWKQRAEANGWFMAVFRCAGIYGPHRSALHTVYKNGYSPSEAAPTLSGKTVTNRIHEDDIARAIVASMLSCNVQEEPWFRVYNVADNEPENRSVVMNYAAQLLKSRGVSVKEAQGPVLRVSERSRRREKDRKRVSNERIRTELLEGYGGLLYPTYREGLRSILVHPSNRWSEV